MGASWHFLARQEKTKKMSCVHMNLDHDTAAEIFVAGSVRTRHELLDLTKVAFRPLLALGISLQVCGSPVTGMASAAAVICCHSSTLLNAIWVPWMLGLCALEACYGGCMPRHRQIAARLRRRDPVPAFRAKGPDDPAQTGPDCGMNSCSTRPDFLPIWVAIAANHPHFKPLPHRPNDEC